MISKKVLTASMSLLGCLTLAMPAAHAGGGMGAGSGVTTCRLVKGGTKPPQIVSVTDPFVSGDVMKVGALALLCDLAAAGSTVNADVVPPTGAPILEPNAVACYLANGDSARILTTVTDPFTEANSPTGSEQVVVGAIQLLCVPAATTNP
jgi:hypothetical protein